MIRSMTAFVRKEIQNKELTGTWEIRSINHRYLEIHTYLPENMKDLEIEIRKNIYHSNNIARGRIECKLHIDIDHNQNTNYKIKINTKLITNLIKLIQNIPNQKNINKIDPIKILSWPGIMISKKINVHTIYPQLLQSFKNALYKLIKMKEQEGGNLKKVINTRLFKINNEINTIKKKIPYVILSQKEKILKKIQEINININNNRLEEELLFYAQKTDISEEIDRLEIHIQNINHIISSENIVGRKLDFIMQELYREVNTISSKSTNIIIIQSSIEIKILIDQIREQLQNIE